MVAAKVGAKRVVLTDFVSEVLVRLAENCHLNSITRDTETHGNGADAAPSSNDDSSLAQQTAAVTIDDFDDFEDAESVDELDLDGGDDLEVSSCRHVGEWEFSNMEVRYMDWKEDYDRAFPEYDPQ